MRDSLITLLTTILARAFPTWRLPARVTFERILIIKPCCLGDVLLATPVIAAIQRAYPHAQIDFAVGSWSRPVVANNPRLHGVVDSGRVGQGAYGWRDVWRLAKQLRAHDYDLCLTLDRSPRVGMVAWLARIPLRAGLDSGGRGFAHNIRVPVPPIRYEPELYLDVARAVVPQTSRAKFEIDHSEFFPTADDIASVATILPDSALSTSSPPPQSGAREARGGDMHSPLIAVHPGGGNNPGMVLASKRWPPERFAAIAERLIAEHNATVVLIGARDDAPLTRAVRAAMLHPRPAGEGRGCPVPQAAPADAANAAWHRVKGELIDLTGLLTIGQLGALYQRCALMLGNDSGVMHLANAVGTPVVALYGPSDPRVYGPYDQKSLALWHEVGCNPCFVNGRARADCCPHHSIDALSEDEVWEAVQIVLRRQGVVQS